jgi:hypothetical protein
MERFIGFVLFIAAARLAFDWFTLIARDEPTVRTNAAIVMDMVTMLVLVVWGSLVVANGY